MATLPHKVFATKLAYGNSRTNATSFAVDLALVTNIEGPAAGAFVIGSKAQRSELPSSGIET